MSLFIFHSIPICISSILLSVEELKESFTETEMALTRLTEGTEAVRLAVSDTQLLEEADNCLDRSKGIFDKIVEGAARLEGTPFIPSFKPLCYI